MLGRAWSLLAGLPLGALAGLVLLPDASPQVWTGCALAGGVLLALAVTLLGRVRDDEPERGAHLARGAGSAFAALPVCFAVLLGLPPGAVAWLVLCVIGVAIALWLAARRGGASGGVGHWFLTAALALVAGDLAVLLLGGALIWLASERPVPTPSRAAAIYDADARVETRPLPDCSDDAPRVRVLLERGAHPKISGEGATIWFDAIGPEGRRQIHRFERATGAVECWTCGEPGHNYRPSPDAGGFSLVFTTDRHRSWRHPWNSEIHMIRARASKTRVASRRLTFDPGPDDHGMFAPSSPAVVWSRGGAAGFEIVSAGISTGHGGIVMGRGSPYVAGGTRWVAPMAWSADARSLVYVSGNPWGPLEGRLLDPASGQTRSLGDLAWGARVDFSADGGWLAGAGGRRNSALGLLPGFLGFVLGPFASRHEIDAVLFQGTEIFSGATAESPAALLVPEVADWGAATGVALEPDGTGLVVGQRRQGATGVEERIVELRRSCSAPPPGG